MIRIILVSFDCFINPNKTDGSIQRNRFILDVMEVFILLQYYLVRESQFKYSLSRLLMELSLEDANMGFEVITSEKFVEIGAPKVAERIKNKVGDNPVYVSVDIDVLDPAFAPGISLFAPNMI